MKFILVNYDGGIDCEDIIINATREHEWHELPDEEYDEFKLALKHYNSYYNSLGNFYNAFNIIEFPDQQKTVTKILDSFVEIKEKIMKQNEERLKKEQERKEKSAAQALERKKKQLEKLKKELGDD